MERCESFMVGGAGIILAAELVEGVEYPCHSRPQKSLRYIASFEKIAVTHRL